MTKTHSLQILRYVFIRFCNLQDKEKIKNGYARCFYTVKCKGQGMIHDVEIKWNSFPPIFMDWASSFQSIHTGSLYLVFRPELPLDLYSALVTLRHNLYFHWGCRGTVSSRHPFFFFFFLVPHWKKIGEDSPRWCNEKEYLRIWRKVRIFLFI